MSYLSKLTKRLAHSRALIIFTIGVAACTAGDRAITSPAGDQSFAVTTSSTPAATVVLSPSSAAGSIGQSAQFTASEYAVSGTKLAGTTTWSSSDSTVVTVSSTGFATAIGTGSAILTATINGVSGHAQTTVSGDAVASISISPSSAAGNVGQQAQFKATLYDASGSVLSGRRVLWTTSNPAVVSVDTTGFATGTGAGSATITATSCGKSASAAITVTGTGGTTVSPVATITVTPGTISGNVGQSAQFTATAKDVNGNVLSGQTITWSTTNSAVVTVNSSGYGTGTGAGTAAIVASSGGKTGQAQVTVAGTTTPPPTVGSIAVSPTSASISTGATQQMTPTLTSTAGSVLSGQTVTWASNNSAVATVSGGGLVTGIAAGSAMITATSGGVSSSSSISVTSSSTAPPPSSSGEPMPTFGTMIWNDAFNELSDAAMLASYELMTGNNAMHADPTAGPNGGGALRIDWNRSTTCQDDWSGIERGIPGTPTELYIQYSVKYQPGFSFDWLYSGQTPCTGTAKKLLLIWSGDNKSRFIFVSENHVLHAGSDYDEANETNMSQNIGTAEAVSQLGDGNWHRITFHIKQSSTTTSTDGFLYGWIDGVQRWSRPNWATGSIGGWVDLKMPSTFNQGSPAVQSEWMTNLSIWHP